MDSYTITFVVCVSEDADPSAVLDGAIAACDTLRDSIATEARCYAAPVDEDEVSVQGRVIDSVIEAFCDAAAAAKV